MKQTSDNIIKISDLVFSWDKTQSFVLSMKLFEVKQQERILLLGPSGSGKSTLLSLICGIVSPNMGEILISDTDIASLGSAKRDKFRADKFGIIFQMFNLLPYGTVLDNVRLPLSFSPKRRKHVDNAGGIETEAKRLLTRLGLEGDQFHKKSASDLSVGQQQRVAVARALIGAPDIIIADEPTSALDKARRAYFLELLSEEVTKAKSTLLMVSHDEDLASHFDRVVALQDIIDMA